MTADMCEAVSIRKVSTIASDVFVFGFFRGNIHPDWIPRFGTSLQKMQWSCQGRRHEERWHNRWGTWWINMICYLCFQAYDFIPMVLARISTAPRSTLHSPHAAPEPFVRMTFIRVSQSGQIWALQCRPDKILKNNLIVPIWINSPKSCPGKKPKNFRRFGNIVRRYVPGGSAMRMPAFNNSIETLSDNSIVKK